MKKLIFFIILSILGINVTAQQQPQYTQYIFNNYLLNPAISGIENYIDVKAGYRNQWTGFDGAPVTSYFSIQGPLGKKDLTNSATSFGGQENNPMSRSYVQDYAASEPHHGIGLYGVTDKAGPINRFTVNGTYAYHLGITSKINLALGIAAGISKLSINKADITLTDNSDPVLTSNNSSQLKPDLAVGLWLYGPRYFIGLAGQQLINPYSGFGSFEVKSEPVFIATTGYKFFAAENIGIIPSIMVRKASAQPISYDLNFKAAFQDKFWLGGGYRHNDSFNALAGFYISDLFNLSYSYDFTVSELAKASRGSHEIVIGILLNNRYKVTCPQANW